LTVSISQSEIRTLLDTISKSGDPFSKRDKTLFALYAFTGIRKSEALLLRISDYDRDSKLLHLPYVKRSSKKFQVIPSILTIILDDYLKNTLIIDLSSPLFTGNSCNRFLTSRQVSYRFDKWKTISGIRRNLTIHSFRAAYASLLYQKTKNPLLVSYALGHSSFNTTKDYILDDSFDFRSTIEKIFAI